MRKILPNKTDFLRLREVNKNQLEFVKATEIESDTLQRLLKHLSRELPTLKMIFGSRLPTLVGVDLVRTPQKYSEKFENLWHKTPFWDGFQGINHS